MKRKREKGAGADAVSRLGVRSVSGSHSLSSCVRSSSGHLPRTAFFLETGVMCVYSPFGGYPFFVATKGNQRTVVSRGEGGSPQKIHPCVLVMLGVFERFGLAKCRVRDSCNTPILVAMFNWNFFPGYVCRGGMGAQFTMHCCSWSRPCCLM